LYLFSQDMTKALTWSSNPLPKIEKIITISKRGNKGRSSSIQERRQGGKIYQTSRM